MTLLGRLISFFPLLQLLTIGYVSLKFLQNPGVVTLLVVVGAIYLMPPLLFRLYSLKYPIKAGRWVLNRPQRCDWWVAHQMQSIYSAVPMLEAVLRLIPGCYSAWLRLWGSKIGKRVHWTSLVEIVDRHMLRVGDDVIFGHQVICSSHVISRKANGDLILILRPTRIGSGTLLGARARIGPGVSIPEKSTVPYNAEYRFSYAE